MAAGQGRISKHPDIRREEILAAALELFMSVGYQKTSVQMITERVGVAKGLFYHYFDSKVDLLNQVAMWQADQILASVPEPSEMEGDALDKLRALIGMFVQWKLEDARELISAYLEVMYRPENAPLRIAVVQESVARIIPVFGEIIAEGVEEGICDVDDPAIAAEMVFNLWTGSADRLAALLLDIGGASRERRCRTRPYPRVGVLGRTAPGRRARGASALRLRVPREGVRGSGSARGRSAGDTAPCRVRLERTCSGRRGWQEESAGRASGPPETDEGYQAKGAGR